MGFTAVLLGAHSTERELGLRRESSPILGRERKEQPRPEAGGVPEICSGVDSSLRVAWNKPENGSLDSRGEGKAMSSETGRGRQITEHR